MKNRTLVISANTSWNLYSRKRLLVDLQAAGWKLVALSNPDDYSRILADELGIHFVPLPMVNDGTSIRKDFTLFLRFFAYYVRFKPAAALHINNKPNIYGSIAASLLGIPSLSNITGLGVVAEKKGFTQQIVYGLYRFAFMSRKSFVFFQNPDDKCFFIDKKIVNGSRTGLLPGSGVNTAYFDFTGMNETENITFLFNGRLVISKGIRDFIKAAGLVHHLYPKCNFIIIGEHDPSNSIFIPVEELDSAVKTGFITYAGMVKDVRPYIRQASCVVLPSWYREGVPRSLLEAASMGRPLIVADSIGTREPVENGVNGFLTVPADPNNVADAMGRFIRSSMEQKCFMGQESRRIAVTRFDDALVSAAYLSRLPDASNADKELS